MRMFVLLALALLGAVTAVALGAACAHKTADAANVVTKPPTTPAAAPAPAKPTEETAACGAESSGCTVDACATCPKTHGESGAESACAGDCAPESCATCAERAKKSDEKTESAALSCAAASDDDSSGT